MEINRAVLIGFILILTPLVAISATNPKWITKISLNVSPALLMEGKQVTFSAKLKVKRGPVDDLKVVVRLDSTKIWEKVFPHLEQNAERTVSVNWTAIQGNHRIKFRIDPQNTSGDAVPEDNSIKKDFSVGSKQMGMLTTTASLGPDLELALYSLPKSPQVGDRVDVTGRIKNIGDIDSKACSLRFKTGDRYYETIYPVPLIEPGRHFEVTLQKTLRSAITYTMSAELWNSTDKNQANNKASLDIIPRAPDLIITKLARSAKKTALGQPVKIMVTVKNIGNADSGPFDIDASFEPCKGIAQGRRWAHVDNLKPQEEVTKEILHRFHCIGYKTLKRLEIDKENKVVESNEGNNTWGSFPLWKVGKFK